MPHQLSIMEKITVKSVYDGAKALFRCPHCGNEKWQLLSFLGNNTFICDGEKITKRRTSELGAIFDE
mgnify:CR=1 FL=1